MSKSLRLTVTSDCHISDWTQHSELGLDGRPSRLVQYLTLAEDILAQAEKNESDAIVIAGDLVESSLLRPMVLDVLDEFISILSEFPLFITHGQHDLDVKKNEISQFHSVLSHLGGRNNINYADRPKLYRLNGYKIFVCPWNQGFVELQEADVFVGHGIVSGSSNFERYVFQGGFKKEELWNNFRISIIGDIHNAQTFQSGDRLILVPGSPLQNSFRDSPVTGIWNVNLDSDYQIQKEFICVHDIRPNFYHKFLFTEDPEQNSTPLIHYRYRAPKETRRNSKKENGNSFQDISLLSITSDIIDQSKVESKDRIRETISSAVSSLKNSDRRIPRSKIHSFHIHNFMSVGDFSLDMNEFSDNLIVTGENGTGKTSLFEAILWCLTGTNTRGVSVSDVVNDYATDGTAWVTVNIEIEETLYQIRRQRSEDGPSLAIGVWSEATGAFVEQDRSTSVRTQDTIHQMIGLTSSEILLLCYFSAKEPVLFGTLGPSDKNSLMATISGSSEVDTLRNVFADKLSNLEREMIGPKSKIDTLRKITEDYKSEICKLLDLESSNNDNDLQKLLSLRQDIKTQIDDYDTEDIINDRLIVTSDELSRLSKSKDSLTYELSNLRDRGNRIAESLLTIKKQMKKAMEGKCPTCGQELYDEGVLYGLSRELSEMISKAPTEETLDTKSLELNKISIELNVLTSRKSDLEQDLSVARNLNRSLRDTNDKITDMQKGRPDYSSVIKAHQGSIDRNSAEISGTEAVLSNFKIEYDCSKWIHGTLLKRNGPLIQELNKRTKYLLQEQIDLLISGEDFSIMVEDDLSISGSFLGRDLKSYKKLSMGQERICDIVMMISLSNLFTKLYALEEGVLGLAIFDEVFSFLDKRYVDFCYNVLQFLNVPKRIVVSHDPMMISKFDHRINTNLSGKGSSCYTKSWN
jgi:DNA repair exonuclease SbcCD nuclease subunit